MSTQYLDTGKKPFIPSTVFHKCTLFPVFDFSDGVRGGDRFSITSTGFIVPESFTSGFEYSTDTIAMQRLTVALADIDTYNKRLEYLASSGGSDTAGFEWFIKLFKYAVFPQMVHVDKLYKEGTTQRALLSGLYMLFSDKFSPDMKSLMYQAVQHPSVRNKLDGSQEVVSAVFTHQQFADWMYIAMQTVPYQALVKITKIMFGYNKV
jgi:hypothetical protein